MGRRKLDPGQLRLVDQDRRDSFFKRCKGLFKKAHDLSTLCGCSVYLLVEGEDGRVYGLHRKKCLWVEKQKEKKNKKKTTVKFGGMFYNSGNEKMEGTTLPASDAQKMLLEDPACECYDCIHGLCFHKADQNSVTMRAEGSDCTLLPALHDGLLSARPKYEAGEHLSDDMPLVLEPIVKEGEYEIAGRSQELAYSEPELLVPKLETEGYRIDALWHQREDRIQVPIDIRNSQQIVDLLPPQLSHRQLAVDLLPIINANDTLSVPSPYCNNSQIDFSFLDQQTDPFPMMHIGDPFLMSGFVTDCMSEFNYQ
eukprot:c30996_g1_i1 orf=129-1058(+)